MNSKNLYIDKVEHVDGQAHFEVMEILNTSKSKIPLCVFQSKNYIECCKFIEFGGSTTKRTRMKNSIV